jgi:hypothetical protein
MSRLSVRTMSADREGQLMQPTVQQSEQRERQRSRGRPFVKGRSGNPAGSRGRLSKRAMMQAEITTELGGHLSAADQIMLEPAVELLSRRPQSHNEAVRLVNAGSRILGQLRAKYALKDAPARDEVLAGREEPDDARTSETERESRTWVNEGNGLLRNRSGETLSENELRAKYPNAKTITLNVFGKTVLLPLEKPDSDLNRLQKLCTNRARIRPA